MENEDKYLVEVFYKKGRKTRRVFSFISKDSIPAPKNIWASIERGIESEFGELSWSSSELTSRISYLPEE